MASPKSPFKVYQNFISPKACEKIVDDLGFYLPDVNVEGEPMKMTRHHPKSNDLIYEYAKNIIPELQSYYGYQHRGTETITFEYIPEGCSPEPISENSNYVGKKWARVRDRDISAILFLSSHQDHIPFDSDYEVYGGKLEFPQHNFGFNPERGTLITYPSGPHFINAFAPIIAGDLFVARFHFAAEMPYLYNPNNFPGNYTNWFNDLE